MGRVATRRIVAAGAIVKNKKTVGDSPIMNFPRQPVGADSLLRRNHQGSVSKFVFVASPKPASVRFLNLLPKTNDCRSGAISVSARIAAKFAPSCFDSVGSGEKCVAANGANAVVSKIARSHDWPFRKKGNCGQGGGCFNIRSPVFIVSNGPLAGSP